MTGKKVTIFGTSHAYALIAGLDREIKNIYSHKLLADFPHTWQIVEDGDGPPKLREEIAAWIDVHLDADYIIAPLVGSNWLEYCASNRDPKFDIILPNAPELPELSDAELIPLAEIRHEIGNRIRLHLRGMEALRNYLSERIAIWSVAPPPPIECNDRLRELAPFAAAEISKHGVTDPVLRLKVYKLSNEIIAAKCAAIGMRFLPPPDDAMVGLGFLAPECIHHDAFHANARYGWHVLRQVERLLDAEP
jgi:hypothetical protein